tara:strand:+ start:117 stop:656 length:540 start_codon:yes stop_codon:yes gene_type:complete
MITIDATGLVTGGTGGHGLRSPGSVVQTLQTVKTDTSSVTSVNSFEDISGMSVAITPTSTTSKVLVTLDMRLGTNSNRNITYRLMRGSTVIYVGDAASNRTQCTGGMRMLGDEKYEMRSETAVFLDSPSTTSATTYKVQWTQTYSSSGESQYINRSYNDADSDDRNRGASSITVMEIAV